MKNERKRPASSAFDCIVAELTKEYDGSDILDECMKLNPHTLKKYPLRYRLIALGFVKHMSLDELNEKLMQAGLERLYSRSLWEASLIYAFCNKMDYPKWRGMQEICGKFLEEQGGRNDFFQNNGITFAELAQYLEENSDRYEGTLHTRKVTLEMEEKIYKLAGEEDFYGFLRENQKLFSAAREKARYYFCKYLYYMLKTRQERYISAVQAGIGIDYALSDLCVLKSVTQLRRKKMSPEESRKVLEQSRISCGEIFDEINYFFFEYVSLDWMDVLIEYYGNIGQLPENQKKKLAASLRRYDKGYVGLSDDEAVCRKQKELEQQEKELDLAYSLDSPGRGYQKKRAGENTVRKYIQGLLDIDRTSLICFLLFFGSGVSLEKSMAIDRGRLTEILWNCGFEGLNEENDFDYFVIQYLESEAPAEYLMREVTDYALSGENFYLYRMYSGSRSAEEDFRKLIK